MIGTLCSDGVTWGNHVATTIRAEAGGCWVIDPVTDVVKAEDWIKYMKRYNPSGDAQFFVSDAARFSPYRSAPYRKVDLDNTANYYKGFFNELPEVERERILKNF